MVYFRMYERHQISEVDSIRLMWTHVTRTELNSHMSSPRFTVRCLMSSKAPMVSILVAQLDIGSTVSGSAHVQVVYVECGIKNLMREV